MKPEQWFWNLMERRFGARFAPITGNTWEAGPAAVPELHSDRESLP